MENHHDDTFSIDAHEEVLKEKTKITEVATATLSKLNNIMKQMKDWRDDRTKLKCNIWGLKMALRVAGKEAEHTLQADPLIEYQRDEIKRLQTTNDALKKEISDIKGALIETQKDITRGNCLKRDERFAQLKRDFEMERERLNNEILYLKTRLKSTEEDYDDSYTIERLRCQLKQFIVGDQTVEILFTDLITKVAETIANLSEELVNVSEHLHRTNIKNDDLYFEIDRLKSVLRSENGTVVDYQKRIGEFDKIKESLTQAFHKFKSHLDVTSWNEDSECSNDLRSVQRLTNDLKKRLTNDREALLAAGDPDCLNYMRNLMNLRLSLKELRVEVDVDVDSKRGRSCEINQCIKRISMLKSTLIQIDVELDKLKDEHVTKQCRASGIESLRYLKKVEELETIVDNAKRMIKSLNTGKTRNSEEKKAVERLEDIIRQICHEIKELEVIVASNNRSSLLKRIEQLEDSIVRSKVELSEKKERGNVLIERFSKARTELEERSMELKGARIKVTKLTEENENLKERIRSMEEKMLEASKERDGLKKEMEESQQVRTETNVMRQKLYDLQVDKDRLSDVVEEMRKVLLERNEEIGNILTERDTVEKTLNVEIANFKMKLQMALDVKEKLERELEDTKESHERDSSKRSAKLEEGDTKCTEEPARNSNEEVQQLKLQLDISRKNLDNANREIIDLKARLNHFSNDNANLETSIFHLESKKEILVYQFGPERTTVEERVEEFKKLTSDYNELENEKNQAKKRNEQLEIKLIELQNEKELLKNETKDGKNDRIDLEDRINKYKSDVVALDERIVQLERISKDLTSTLKKTEMKMSESKDEKERLEIENSKLYENLDALTLKNTTLDARVQVLLTEKDDLATRINDLYAENVALIDQLNKVKTENEYSAIELNESRIENDKAKSENVTLKDSILRAERSNAALKRTNEELQVKLAEIQSEYRIVDNQLKILQMKNDELRKDKDSLFAENGVLKNYFGKNNPRIEDSRVKKGGVGIVSDATLSEPLDLNDQCAIRKIERNECIESDKKVNVCGKRKSPDDKAKTKVRTKDETKRLKVENEALKYELINLRTHNCEVRLELSRTKDEFERLRIELAAIRCKESAISPISNKLEIVNLYYKQDVNSYLTRYSDESVNLLRQLSWSNTMDRLNVKNLSVDYESRRGLKSWLDVERLLRILDKLKVENVALKIEVNALRCNVVACFMKDEKGRNELRNTVEEMRALKLELAKVREEKESLCGRLDVLRREFDEVKSEKVALKDELVNLRGINSELREKGEELQRDYRRLKEMSCEFEERLMSAVKGVKVCTCCKDQSSFDEELKNILKGHISGNEFLRAACEGMKEFDKNSVEKT